MPCCTSCNHVLDVLEVFSLALADREEAVCGLWPWQHGNREHIIRLLKRVGLEINV